MTYMAGGRGTESTFCFGLSPLAKVKTREIFTKEWTQSALISDLIFTLVFVLTLPLKK